VALEGERLTSSAIASDKIGHHSNLLTYRVPNSSMHWPPKKTNSPSMPIAARTVHLGHGMAMSRICAGNRSIFQHGTWVPRNRPQAKARLSRPGFCEYPYREQCGRDSGPVYLVCELFTLLPIYWLGHSPIQNNRPLQCAGGWCGRQLWLCAHQGRLDSGAESKRPPLGKSKRAA
jgi:hypothetical protein